MNWLQEAQYECIMLGQAHGEWSTDLGFESALAERLRKGVRVEILFLDPNGPAADVRHKEDVQRAKPLKNRIRTSISVIWNIRERLENQEKERLKLYVYNATPSLGLILIDDTMLVTHYLAGFINLTSPLLSVEFRPAHGTLYGVYKANVEEILAHFATVITAENIANYVPKDTNE